jgi:hypothetical protein
VGIFEFLVNPVAHLSQPSGPFKVNPVAHLKVSKNDHFFVFLLGIF